MSPTTTRAEDPDVTRVRQLVVAQDAARTAVALQATAMVRNSAQNFTGWYDHEQIYAWATGLARQVEALQRSLARSTDAYFARVSTQITGKRVRPVGAVDVTNLRQGVTHAGAYARAADVYRFQQSQFDKFAIDLQRSPDVTPDPPTIVHPVDAAIERAQAVADADTQLVVRHQAQAFIESQRDIIGWRRVIHPERSKGGTCGLCVAASTRLYGKTEPLPIHAHCQCVPMQVYDGRDVADDLNKHDLGQLYDDASGISAANLKRTRYKVTEHGELGPVLHPFDKPLRTREQIRADSKNPRRKSKTAEQRQADVQRVMTNLEPGLTRVEDLARENPQKWGDYEALLQARMAELRDQLAA